MNSDLLGISCLLTCRELSGVLNFIGTYQRPLSVSDWHFSSLQSLLYRTRSGLSIWRIYGLIFNVHFCIRLETASVRYLQLDFVDSLALDHLVNRLRVLEFQLQNLAYQLVKVLLENVKEELISWSIPVSVSL
jgi:hypothetical protein